MKITLINKNTGNPYPNVTIGDRTFYAIEDGQTIRVRTEWPQGGLREVTVMVDGRDALTNSDGDIMAPGMVTRSGYECNGFRVGANTELEFVARASGHGRTTAEKTGSANLTGVVVVTLHSGYDKAPRRVLETASKGYLDHHSPLRSAGPSRGVTAHVSAAKTTMMDGDDGDDISFSAPIERGSLGVTAGAAVHSPTTTIDWQRSHAQPEVAVVEYDTFENLKRRNIFVPLINPHWPPPPTKATFANPSTL